MTNNEKQRVIAGLRDVDAIVHMPDGGWIRSCNVAAVVVCETSSDFQIVEVHMLGGTTILLDFARPGAWRVDRADEQAAVVEDEALVAAFQTLKRDGEIALSSKNGIAGIRITSVAGYEESALATLRHLWSEGYRP